MPPAKFQYRVISTIEEALPIDKHAAFLNAQAEQGWRLVSVSEQKGSCPNLDRYTFYFEKPVE